MNAPAKRPEAGFDEMARYAQRKMDMINLGENRFASVYFIDVANQRPELPVEMFASIDRGVERSFQRSRSNEKRHWILTFDKVLSNTEFITDMREMLRILRKTYEYYVDIEFAANFSSGGKYKINLLQCQPLQIKEGKPISSSIPQVEMENLVPFQLNKFHFF